MVSVPLRGFIIFLCLLPLCVEGIQDVNTVCLAKMTQYFYDNVQPKTGQGADAQYALSIYVPPAHCTDKHSKIENVFDKFDAAERFTAQETLEYLLQSSEEEENAAPDDPVDDTSEEEDFTEADTDFESEEEDSDEEGPSGLYVVD
ncbi:hypothetical protein Q8A67_006353 [Cirrhinus molitorella]|uniref:Uncharacterized protein n=1 Tax=Cirrhinus molitorella TaxID=172907 RepID=A0AA88Q7Q0_9TELE|nr:hypothetical protein Q8A67_006353 [Cirrhinus molitorella]